MHIHKAVIVSIGLLIGGAVTFSAINTGIPLLPITPNEVKIARSIPPYPNSASWPIKWRYSLGEGPTEANINFCTSDTSDRVLFFYKEHLLQQGWQVVSEWENRRTHNNFGAESLGIKLSKSDSDYSIWIVYFVSSGSGPPCNVEISISQ